MSASCLVIDVGRTGVVLGVVALAAGALTGCVAQGCPAWAGYDTPTEAAEAADAVVFGHVRKLASTGSLFGAAANIWSVEVTEWVKGAGPDTMTIGYVSFLCGPPILGFISEQLGLLNTLYILVALAVASGVASSAAKPIARSSVGAGHTHH